MNGCTDVGGILDTNTLDGIAGNVTDGSFGVSLLPSTSIAGKLSPGDRIRIEGSSSVGHAVSSSLRPYNFELLPCNYQLTTSSVFQFMTAFHRHGHRSYHVLFFPISSIAATPGT